MIEKFRKIQDSWAMKLVLILTAVSFMSLFGMAGYIDSASKNKTVIRVDDVKVSQNEIMGMLNQDLQTAKALFGDNLTIDDSMKHAILQGIVQRELNNIIVSKTARAENISVSKDLLKKIIHSQNEFRGEKGRFDMALFRRFLSASRQSEQGYINSLQLDLQKQYLVTNMVKNINLPDIAKNYFAQTSNLQKVFQYIKVEPSKLNVNRAISQDELEQYYDDFASDFIEPEVRDVSYVFIPVGKDYDKTVELASKIEDAIGGGASLAELSKEFNAPIIKVSGLNDAGEAKNIKNNLISSPDFVNTVFSYNKGEISQVIETEEGFFFMHIDNITDAHPKPIESVRSEIEKMWKINEQNAIAQEIINDVNHDLESGDKLPEIATRFSLDLKTTKPLQKSDYFDSLGSAVMEDLFKEKQGVAKTIDLKSGKMIVVATKVYNNKNSTIDNSVMAELKDIISQEATQDLIDSYGQDYKIRVKYKYLGMSD